MLISTKASATLSDRISRESEIFCQGLFLSARWFVASQVARKGLQLIILPDRESAEYCSGDLYNLTEGDIVFHLPESGKGVERSNYKSTLGVQRTAALEKILSNKGDLLFVVSYPEALEEQIPVASKMKGAVLTVKKGQTARFDKIIETLGTSGFERVDFVGAPGQFAVRGSLIDIFSYAASEPFRLSFWGDEIEDIRIFDPNTQTSKETVDKADIVSSLLSDAASEDGRSILEILPADTTVWLDSSDIYRERAFFPALGAFKRVYTDIPLDSKDSANPVRFSISPQPTFNKNFELLGADIAARLESGFKVYIYGEKQSQLDRLRSILSENGGRLPEFVKGRNIHAGFIDSEDKICCYTDHEIFDRFHRVQLRRSVEKTEQLTLNDLNSFNIGDYVVHIDHGVGTFGGLVRMTDDRGRAKEVVKLVYRDGDVVFVSVHNLNKISRFRSADGVPPKINKLGGKAWENLKGSAKRKVKDIAKDLIQLYAKRKATKGFAFSGDTYMQDELESSFMYEDTPDQEAATAAVKRDMEETHPMDRLICGDVGFGKTEIAIRAAFKAVSDNKQVAVLVPTTILALQHYNTFSERLKGFPCNIEFVSRLKTAKQITEIKEKLAKGQIDIIIGTHKLLGAGFAFRDLGLLVIDEEQKFGVGAKEKLRQLKVGVDTLTLTATPIPRTLQFSLLGARDLSIIQTAPPNRIPIQTEIILFDENEIRSIINYELNRGGQVFFLHNKVEELPSIHDILHRLLPDARICVAHGQMKSEELENRILDFMRGDYDILLCTTIIENGLDIPNANTIIINQAQNIGLSDLHQLRGRVGRSNRKAFCYLIVPPLVSITEDSRRRLRAIEEFSDLGSGFNIAMQDLDIRGAGNLLGAEQSGFIMEMGYETYQKILEEAMAELGLETGLETARGRRGAYVEECAIETDQPAFIPDSYIDITAEKIRIYKHLDSLTDDRSLDRYASVTADRFGPLPQELQNLFNVVKIRNLGAALGFEKIIVKNGMLICFFVGNPMSAYYSSDTFEGVMRRLTLPFEFKQVEGKLKLVARGVDTLEKARALLGKLK
ncbi:MAG: transcription-repair coupling factor [Bacteroidales bacterium]|nr:transcription-repair coupling factor [Bacteroidales bacterium]